MVGPLKEVVVGLLISAIANESQLTQCTGFVGFPFLEPCFVSVFGPRSEVEDPLLLLRAAGIEELADGVEAAEENLRRFVLGCKSDSSASL